MKIAYCTNVRLPNERAHGHQIAEVTQAMGELQHIVHVFSPYRINSITDNFESYYQLRSTVHHHVLGSFDGIASVWTPGVVGLKVTTSLFARELRSALAKSEFDLLYTRTVELLPTLLARRKPVILELHRIPKLGRGRFVRLARRCTLIVALTSPMRNELVEMGISSVPIVVEGDAVDLREFENLPPPSETRAFYRLPENVPLIGYTGQLESMGLSKGIPELLAGLESLHKRGLDFHAVIAGGPEDAKEKFALSLSPELAGYMTFLGYIPRPRIPALLNACDVLVYPAPASNDPYYTRDTSPLKIFEYMAAGKPIVSADLPPIRDTLQDSMAFFCKPGDGESLADALRDAIVNKDEAAAKARVARNQVENYTWEKRMGRILGAVKAQSGR